MRIVSIYILLLVFVSINSFSSVPKDDKKKADQGTDQNSELAYVEGVVYALPRTVFMINVTAQQRMFKPGPYNQFAQKYLGVENVKGKEEVQWVILSVDIENFAEVDSKAMFKAMDTNASRVALLSNGIIAGVNTNGVISSDKVIGSDFIVQTKNNLNEFTDLSSDEFYEIIVNPENGAEAIKVKSLEDKARETADYIIRLRKKRAFSILSPSDVVPEDGLGYEAFLKEAKRLDKEYMALFVGKESTSNFDFSFIYIPGENNIKNEVLFRFSDSKGILPKSDISGKPIFINLEKDENAISVLKGLNNSENPEAGKSGIFYRIPVVATLTISNGLESLYSGRIPVAQFGEIMPVPEKLLDGNFEILFNTQTGSLRSIVEKK